MRFVPALSQRQNAKHKVVSTIVIAGKWPEAPQVTSRVDAPRDVMQQKYADQPAPDETSQNAPSTLSDNATQKRGNDQPEDDPKREQRVGQSKRPAPT